jgi:hypothetical protein
LTPGTDSASGGVQHLSGTLAHRIIGSRFNQPGWATLQVKFVLHQNLCIGMLAQVRTEVYACLARTTLCVRRVTRHTRLCEMLTSITTVCCYSIQHRTGSGC